MIEPMYALGDTTLRVTQGSSIDSMSDGFGSRAGLSTTTVPLAVLQLDVVLDRRRRRDEVEIELPLQPFLDDLHVEQPQEPAAEPEPQRDRALGLEREARVVEVQLVECFAQHRVVLATDGIDACEHEALGRLVSGERFASPVVPAS